MGKTGRGPIASSGCMVSASCSFSDSTTKFKPALRRLFSCQSLCLRTAPIRLARDYLAEDWTYLINHTSTSGLQGIKSIFQVTQHLPAHRLISESLKRDVRKGSYPRSSRAAVNLLYKVPCVATASSAICDGSTVDSVDAGLGLGFCIGTGLSGPPTMGRKLSQYNGCAKNGQEHTQCIDLSAGHRLAKFKPWT